MRKKITAIFLSLIMTSVFMGCTSEEVGMHIYGAAVYATAYASIPVLAVKDAIEGKEDTPEYKINKTPMKLTPGTTKNYYDNKVLKEEIICDKQGFYVSYKSYYENGRLKKDIRYKNGFPVVKKEYHSNGILKLSAVGNGTRRNMKTSIEYDKQGIPEERVISYEKAPKNFDYSDYYKRNNYETAVNKTENEMYRKHGEGIFKEYYDNGQLAAVGAYKNEKPLGFFAEYQKDGTLICEKTYARLDTKGVKWDRITRDKIEQTVYEGKYKVYSPNGNILVDLFYKNGYLDGVQKKYFWNSRQLMYEGNYKNGKKVGVHVYYTAEGKIQESYDYSVKGKLTEKMYYFSGKPQKVFFYDNGELVKTISYDEKDAYKKSRCK